MKKLLSILGAIGLSATASSTVVSCGLNNGGSDDTVPTNPGSGTIAPNKLFDESNFIFSLAGSKVSDKSNMNIVMNQTAVLELDSSIKDLNNLIITQNGTSLVPSKDNNLYTINTRTEGIANITVSAQGYKSITFKIVINHARKNLSDLIKDTSLGSFDDTKPTREAIKVRLETSKIDWAQVSIAISDNENTATLTVNSNSKDYVIDDSLTLTYSITYKKLTNKLTELETSGISEILAKDYSDFTSITSDDIISSLKTSALSEFDQSLDLRSMSFNLPSISNEEITNGSITLSVTYNNVPVMNGNSSNVFTFEFNSPQLFALSKMVTKLNNEEIVGEFKNVGITLSPTSSMSIGSVIELVNKVLTSPIISTIIPEKIPQRFDETDTNWSNWTQLLTLIGGLAGDVLNKEINITKAIDTGTIVGTIDINIKTKVSDLIYALLPDLIHLHNFVSEQRELNGTQNLVLLLVQFLNDSPRDIYDDGYSKIDATDMSGKSIKFSTNLERIIYHLLDGWKNVNGQKIRNESGSDINNPLSISLDSLPIIGHADFVYNNGDLFSGRIGVFDVLPIENIKDLVNQLFNYDLTTTLAIHIKFNIYITKIDIPIKFETLGTTILGSLGNILKIDSDLDGDTSNLDFNWTQGTMTVEYLDADTNQWVRTSSVDELTIGKAIDLRIKFIDNSWTMKAKDYDQTFTFSGKDITLNL